MGNRGTDFVIGIIHTFKLTLHFILTQILLLVQKSFSNRHFSESKKREKGKQRKRGREARKRISAKRELVNYPWKPIEIHSELFSQDFN